MKKKTKTARNDRLGVVEKKKDAPKKEVKQETNKVPIIHELFGVMALAFGAILFCSLISYSPEDNGIHNFGRGEISNWIGPGGAILADVAFMLFGVLAYGLAAGLCALGIMNFLSKQIIMTPVRFSGVGLLFVSLAILFDGVERVGENLLYGPGGILGEQLNYYLVAGISGIGTTIVAVAGAISGFILLTSWSLGEAIRTIVSGFQWMLTAITNFLRNLYLNIPKANGFFPKLAADNLKVPKVTIPFVGTQKTSNRSFWDLGSKEVEAEKVRAEEQEPYAHQKPEDGKAANVEPELVDESKSIEAKNLQIVERDHAEAKRLVDEAEKEASKKKVSRSYTLPSLSLLDYDAPEPIPIDEEQLKKEALHLEQTFSEYGISGRVREVRPGPVVTMFEFVPAPGTKLSRIAALADDIAMAMEAVHVRIVAPIPGKGAVGIEIPNEARELVYLKEVVSDPQYRATKHKLTMALGKDIEGKPYFLNLASMPHLLVAGTTGSGKSVSVNGMVCSILYRATPDDVKFIMIDPKMLELSIYSGIPHLMLPPIIDSKKAANALRWAVSEMEGRYRLLNELGVRDIVGYNLKRTQMIHDAGGKEVLSKDGTVLERMPYIVIVVDEYADLVAVGGRDVEVQVMRLAQKARAAGIHVILATQRPSVDIITGVIKANFPVRIGFRLASAHDSKTIINRPGAEKLLGKGDMLILPPGMSNLIRIHGAFVSEKELNRVIDFWKEQGRPEYDMSIIEAQEEVAENGHSEKDDRFEEAVEVVVKTGKCSTSWLQRHLGVGYNRAARIVESMEAEGIIGPPTNARGDREIFGKQEE